MPLDLQKALAEWQEALRYGLGMGADPRLGVPFLHRGWREEHPHTLTLFPATLGVPSIKRILLYSTQ